MERCLDAGKNRSDLSDLCGSFDDCCSPWACTGQRRGRSRSDGDRAAFRADPCMCSGDRFGGIDVVARQRIGNWAARIGRPKQDYFLLRLETWFSKIALPT